MTTVQPCKCEHQFQDERYGKGMRLHNISKDGEKATCTVCGEKKGRKR